MAHHGLIVADAARARFLLADVRLETLDEIVDVIHPASRMPARDLVSDSSGRSRGSTTTPQTPLKDHEAQVFAREVAARAGDLAERAEAWIVVAPPRFLGHLRAELPKALQDRVVAEVDKDLSRLSVHELGPAVKKAIPPRTGRPEE